MTALVPSTIILVAIGYFLCGIPFGLLMGKRSAEHVDVRKVGSGNIGMTNVARAAGAKAAALTFVLDVGKGAVSMAIARAVMGTVTGLGFVGANVSSVVAPVLTLVFCANIFGHVFTPYLHFKGGKGISVGFGSALVMCWPLGLSMLAIFLLFVLPTKYISAGSVAAAIATPFLALLFGTTAVASVFVFLPCTVVVWRHWENIKRLRAGTERKFTVHK